MLTPFLSPPDYRGSILIRWEQEQWAEEGRRVSRELGRGADEEDTGKLEPQGGGVVMDEARVRVEATH